MDTRRLRYLEAMGIQAWQPRGSAEPPGGEPPSVPPAATGKPPSGDARPPPGEGLAPALPLATEMGWEALAEAVATCVACPLHGTRTRTVFGVGDREARWMVIGEAPGADEDRLGEPFVGRAGQLLNAMLRAVGLRREQVYIANILKCRPPGNRDPAPEEVAQCEGYLRRQIQLVRPRLILAVGRVAAQHLLKTTQPLAQLRGRVHAYGEPAVPVCVTYHPAYLLRSPREKRKAWQDLCFARRHPGAEP